MRFATSDSAVPEYVTLDSGIPRSQRHQYHLGIDTTKCNAWTWSTILIDSSPLGIQSEVLMKLTPRNARWAEARPWEAQRHVGVEGIRGLRSEPVSLEGEGQFAVPRCRVSMLESTSAR